MIAGPGPRGGDRRRRGRPRTRRGAGAPSASGANSRRCDAEADRGVGLASRVPAVLHRLANQDHERIQSRPPEEVGRALGRQRTVRREGLGETIERGGGGCPDPISVVAWLSVGRRRPESYRGVIGQGVRAMTVAEAERRYFDADSHVLEPTDWLTPYADPDIRDRMRTLPNPLAPDNEGAAEIVDARAGAPDDEALYDDRLWGRGYAAYGAWDACERSAILDKYAIDLQLVFSTFAPGPVPLQGHGPVVRRCTRPHPSARRLLFARPSLARGATHPLR